MKIGLRNIKTTIAVFLSILACQILGFESFFFAPVAAIIVMKNTMYGSWQEGRDRLIGTLVGAVVGIIISSLFGPSAIAASLGVMLLIAALSSIGYGNAVGIGAIVLLSIVLTLSEVSPIQYGILRMFETILGIGIAIGVNIAVAPLESKNNIENSYMDIEMKIINIFRDIFRHEESEELQTLRDDIYRFDEIVKSFDMEQKIGSKDDGYKENIENMKEKVALFKDANIHLRVINEMKDKASVDIMNLQSLRDIDYECMLVAVDDSRIMGTEEDVVFNYHISHMVTIMKKIHKCDLKEEEELID